MSSEESDKTGKYRKRIDADSGTLVRQETPRTGDGQGLCFERIGEAGMPPQLSFTSAVDDLLLTDDEEDSAVGDFGIGSLLAEQRESRAGALLQRVQSLISSGEYRAALVLAEQALAVDGDCDEAWVLKGRCLALLDHHDAAIRVFRYARSRVSDMQLRVHILKAEADCVRRSTSMLESQLIQLADKKEFAQALKLVNEGLSKQPSNLVFLYYCAKIHWLSGNRHEAVRTLEEAKRLAGDDKSDLIADLERRIEFGDHFPTAEAARLDMRHGNLTKALEHLDACAEALSSSEQYSSIRAYAEGKRRRLGQFLSRKTQPVAESLRQSTLRWLLAEEIREADDAMRADDLARARLAFERAERIEGTCGALCYRHARAIFLSCRAARETPERAGVWNGLEDLKIAELLIAKATLDPGFNEAARVLGKSIANLRLQWKP